MRFGDILPPYGTHVDLLVQKSSEGDRWYAVSVRNLTWRSIQFVGVIDSSYSHLSCSNGLKFCYAIERRDTDGRWQEVYGTPDFNEIPASALMNTYLRPFGSICGGEWSLIKAGKHGLRESDIVRLRLFTTPDTKDLTRRAFTTHSFRVGD